MVRATQVPVDVLDDTQPLSSIVMDEFCMIFPVVPSKRAMALSVEEAGPTTSPLADELAECSCMFPSD